MQHMDDMSQRYKKLGLVFASLCLSALKRFAVVRKGIGQSIVIFPVPSPVEIDTVIKYPVYIVRTVRIAIAQCMRCTHIPFEPKQARDKPRTLSLAVKLRCIEVVVEASISGEVIGGIDRILEDGSRFDHAEEVGVSNTNTPFFKTYTRLCILGICFQVVFKLFIVIIHISNSTKIHKIIQILSTRVPQTTRSRASRECLVCIDLKGICKIQKYK